MSRARAIAAATMLLASSEALAYVRETTVGGDPAAGKCLYWGTRTVPYKVNATSAAAPPLRPACPSCAPCLDAAAATALIAATLPAWNSATQAGGAQACTDFTLQNGGTSHEHGAGQRRGEPDRLPDRLVPARASSRRATRAGARWAPAPPSTTAGSTTRAAPSASPPSPTTRRPARWSTPTSSSTAGTATSRQRVLPHLRDLAGLRQSALRPGETARRWTSRSVALHEAGHVVGLDHTCVYPSPVQRLPARTR